MHSVDGTQTLSPSDVLRLWEPILDSVSDGVVIADARQADQPVLFVNRAFEMLTGYAADEVRDRNCRFLQGEDRGQPAIVTLREAIREVRPTRVVLRNYRKDGELFWNQVTLTPVPGEDGEVVRFVAILRDVTAERALEDQIEQQRARERALQDSEERFRQIAEHLDDAVWLTPVVGRQALYANRACEGAWGRRPAAPGTEAWLRPIHPEDRDAARTLVSSARRAHDPPAEAEFRVSAETGKERWMRGRVVPILDLEKEREVRRMVIVQDITEQHRIQEKLRRTNDTLAATVQELARRNLQMLALNETVDHLQGCATVQEAEEVLEECVPEIFPQEAGGLYLLDGQRTALQPLVVWGAPAPTDRPFPPEQCQALRRNRDFWTEASHPPASCDHYRRQPEISDLCLSLRSHSQALGLLHLRVAIGDDPDGAQDLKAGVLRFAVNAAEQLALTLANIQLRESLHTQAIQDPLTGLYNRRFFNDALDRELRRATRRDSSTALLMIDLDHFKRVNDERGHEAGDHLLQTVAETLRNGVRAEDVIARYGGEEFMVLLPDTGLAEGVILAERLRESFKSLPADPPFGPFTFSVGVAARPDHGTTVEELLQAVDDALYRAKREGRDRVVAAEC